MKKILFLSCALVLSVAAHAAVPDGRQDSIVSVQTYDASDLIKPLKPTYLRGAVISSPWSHGWFMQVAGGGTAFLGSPLGCNDIFGRTKPTFYVSIGKWFTPSIGGRIRYGGMTFKDSQNANQDYQFMTADFLWDVLAGRQVRSEDAVQRWSLIPYIGVGLVHNMDNGKNPFGISCGIQAQYHFSKKVAVLAELGNITTMRDFDGYGSGGTFGDNLLSASVGLSINIGKTGWKRAVDARPYMAQNEWLCDYATTLHHQNERYRSQHERDQLTMEQFRKILSIEGLLDKYAHLFENDATHVAARDYPRNDYSGLNSLRSRMRGRANSCQSLASDGSESCPDVSGTDSIMSDAEYLSLIQSGQTYIGAPIYFFFELGTANLMNESQWVNLEEVARIAKRYGLSIRVVGAADSATGTADINNSLSDARANVIASQLSKCGISSGRIKTSHEGGIDKYQPNEANRHTRVMLYYDRKE